MTDTTAAPPARHFVQSLARGLAVLEAFSEDRPRMTLSEVATATGLTRATARRLVLTLHELGYLRSDGREFEPTTRVMDLGYAYMSSHSVWETVRPIVARLAHATQEASSVTVREGYESVYVVRVTSERLMSIGSKIGARLPLSATSTGRVMLADLPPDELDLYFATADRPRFTDRTVTGEAELRVLLDRIREQGWALVDQELETGVRSIAVPLRDRYGVTVAALNVAAHASRVSAGTLKKTSLGLLRAAAAEIEAELARR